MFWPSAFTLFLYFAFTSVFTANLLLFFFSLELRADVICSRCGEDDEARYRVRLGSGYGGYFFFLSLCAELKSKGCVNASIVDSTTMRTLAIPLP